MREEQLDVATLIDYYKQEVSELTTEKIILKTQLKAAQDELERLRGTSE